MFEETIKTLGAELDDLLAKRLKCEELMKKVQDKEKKDKLATQHDILCHAWDRAHLCWDILNYVVSVEVSENNERAIKFI